MTKELDPYTIQKELAKYVWGLGNYDEIAKRLTIDGARQVLAEVGAVRGLDVLDVGAGNGNFAVLAAQAGAIVTACDLAPGQVERGRARSTAEGLEIAWLQADAEDLPFGDDSFDVVVALFSAMDAPRPQRAAGELFRVVRPGGVVVMANWSPGGFVGAVGNLVKKYSPRSTTSAPDPVDWGIAEIARERLAPHAARIRVEPRMLRYAHESPEGFLAFLQLNHGIFVAAAQFLERDAYQQLLDEVRELVDAFNVADDGRLAIDVDFLLVVAEAEPAGGGPA